MSELQKKRNSYYTDVFKRFKRHKLAMFGIAMLTIIILAVLLLPMIFKLDPYTTMVAPALSRPSVKFILGTDATGRDNFARLLYGGRVSLLVGLASTFISIIIGVPLGLIAAYYRGIAEIVIMRIVDIFMSFPSMVLIMVLVSIMGPSIWSVTVVIGVLEWTQFARQIYGTALSIREKEYIEAARAVGASDFRIITRYILPNSIAPILIAATFRTAAAMLQESTLSFLGMGVQPPQASWGNILYNAQSIAILSTRPWMWVPAGILLILTVLSVNFVGDGLRDALDPKMKV
ncbi:ABC transporter permease [Tepidanaerobacter syntrophicus]|uniref:Peptide/nickel transport system permease protein n=1 Tax=Tepidanaerobacter syntrophicus TaxID=224999 RepID=A0A0U9HP03_9FIRM|nr:ABC transporter permease [Tepidanaerobacter syntrophicus]GAQ24727.1 peptide/nickel transport system permease protein [Tepidanaerobacter syntrophicus]GLI19004.1 peptide ABC transporter permease [Tepidanaerobacter syntrophicus]